jgi:hypothetical protein
VKADEKEHGEATRDRADVHPGTRPEV